MSVYNCKRSKYEKQCPHCHHINSKYMAQSSIPVDSKLEVLRVCSKCKEYFMDKYELTYNPE